VHASINGEKIAREKTKIHSQRLLSLIKRNENVEKTEETFKKTVKF
jgi:hypothetical protein